MHRSIDRILALWEAINPDSYVEPMADTYGTFVIEAGTVEDANTPLYPFHRSDDPNDFWTSAASRSTRDFGYTYPEIQDWGVDQGTLQNNVRTAINNLYNSPARMGPMTPKTARQRRESLDESNSPGGATTMRTKAVTGKMTRAQFDSLGVNNLPKNWAINVAVDK
jgi:tyrosinase